MEEKTHGNAGNQNALKGDAKADSFLQMRIERRIKSALVKQAQRDGKKLTEWAMAILVESVDEDIKEKFNLNHEPKQP